MGRFDHGLDAVRTALNVLRDRPRLLAVPGANLPVVALLALATYLGTGRLEWALAGASAGGFGIPLAETGPFAGFAALFGVAVAHCAAATLEDTDESDAADASVRDGLAAAWRVRWPALAWGLAAAAVVPGVGALAVAAGLPAGTTLAGALLVAVTVPTVYVVPDLALGSGSLATAVRDSAVRFLRRPVDTVVVLVAAVALAAPLWGVGLFAGTSAVTADSLAGLTVWVAGVGLFQVGTVVFQAVAVVGAVVVYRDDDGGRPPEAPTSTPDGAADA